MTAASRLYHGEMGICKSEWIWLLQVIGSLSMGLKVEAEIDWSFSLRGLGTGLEEVI